MNPTASPPASAEAAPPAPGPLGGGERLVQLDVLRGFALLGILVMNVQSFAMPAAAYLNPTAYGDLGGANYAVWLVSHLLADQKFMTVFSMLFGAGIVLMADREAAAGRSPARLHYRRMAVLLVFGLLHAYLLWDGDILYSYAVCGMLVYPFRRHPPWLLLPLGAVALAVPSGIYASVAQTLPYLSEEERQALARDTWDPPPEGVAEEVAGYRGNWVREIIARAPRSLYFQTTLFAIWLGWRAGGLMLVGMALFRLGVFTGRRSPRFYATLVLLAVAVGLPVIAYGVRRNFAAGWDLWALFVGSQYNYWGSLVVSLGWVGLVMLACRSRGLLGWLRPLAAVGQMALTNYLLQTLICTSLFYGRGLGWFGQVERTGQAVVVVAVWAVQLVVSPLWLRAFRFGPAEWLWRSLAYGRRQPLLRGG